MEVPVRMLNERLTGYLERAHNGERILITRHGKAYAEIGPPSQETSPNEKSDLCNRLRAIPGVTWSGHPLPKSTYKPVRLRGKGLTITEMIIDGRR